MTSLRRILSRSSRAPALDGATAWLNSKPLTPANLEGHVVAYDFWTYTCVNWLRTLPYLRAWHERYHEHGLIVIGVHMPEFAFERELANVQEAIAADGIDYAVALNSDYAIWTAFANNYWPALYLADATGTLRHHQVGESDYEQVDSLIRLLLEEAGAHKLTSSIGDLHAEDLGSARSQRFASVRTNHQEPYVIPLALRLNQWGLAGAWTIPAGRDPPRPRDRHDRVSVSRARREPRDGIGARGDTVPGVDPRSSAGRFGRCQLRRPRRRCR
jgi:hypothetical protein